jgi:hypothetical protein
VLLPIVLCFVLTVPVAAQSSARIAGVVRDPSEAAVPGASITVVDQENGFRHDTGTGDDGAYSISSLRPGTYKITVRRDGFRTMVRFGLKLDAMQPARVDFRLSLGSMQEVITVEGSALQLDTDGAAVGTLVDRTSMERLPLNGRGLLGVIALAPGTVVTPATRGEAGQFTANGQRPNTHYFTLDGVSVNSGVSGGGSAAQVNGGTLPAMTALGSLHAIAGLDSVAEARIETATTAPEFGRMPGAQVVLSSRSGGNEWHGSAGYYGRNEHLDANDWFANRAGQSRAPLRMTEFGAAVGGPLRRNHTFFFLDYDGLRLRQPFAWRTAVPDQTVRDAATGWVPLVLNLFPAPNGGALGPGLAEWTGRNQRPARLDTASLRLDQAITSRIAVFARYSQTPSRNEFGNTQINTLSLNSRSFTAGASLRFNAGAALDLRYNHSRTTAESYWQPAGGPLPACYFALVAQALGRTENSCAYLARFLIAGVGQISSGPESDRGQSQSQVAGVAMLSKGDHLVRLGADYRRLAPRRHDRAPTLGLIGDSLTDFLSVSNLWAASAAAIDASTLLGETSLFVQDTWRIGSRLTGTLGLRWELEPAPQRTVPALNPYGDSGLWARRYNNLAPRLGFAFRPRAAGGIVLRAGAGIYYNSSLSIATDLINGGPFSIAQFSSGRLGFVASYLGYTFAPGLRVPWVAQWSGSIEHGTPGHGLVSLGYAGAIGRALLRREAGGPGTSDRLQLVEATNHGSSSFHALEAQARGRFGAHLQGLLSYTWAHSIDNGSSDAALQWTSEAWSAAGDKGPSDFDVRHSFSAALTCDLPGLTGRAPALKAVTRNWQLDGIFRARTGFPIAVLNAESALGLAFANAFRPDLVANAPLWISDRNAPGGRRLNPAAFAPAPGAIPATVTQGNLGRNALRGFGMNEVDLALRREFHLGDRPRVSVGLQAFNALNHPLFGDPARYLSSPLFGQSTSMLNMMLGTGSPGSGLTPLFQAGGPRSIQMMFRLKF